MHFFQEGLAPSTRRSYASGQKRFREFCQQLGKLQPSGSPCPVDEWTLCLFVSHLAGSIQYSSITVYLSAVRALQIEQGFNDPLLNCLRLQRVLRGIKQSQGVVKRERLPITDQLMMVIVKSLDRHNFDHCMFWAACSLAYFGFLRASEFTVPSSSKFSPSVHLQVKNLAVDASLDPTCLQVFIKASKTDPFRNGATLHIGKGSPPLCTLQAVLSYLSRRGNAPGPLFRL